jgi:hypothetical protein
MPIQVDFILLRLVKMALSDDDARGRVEGTLRRTLAGERLGYRSSSLRRNVYLSLDLWQELTKTGR